MQKIPKIKMDDKYYKQCKLNVPRNIVAELKVEEGLFQYIIGILVVNSNEALEYDPYKRWSFSLASEGSLEFKNTIVVFQNSSAVLKTSLVPKEMQNPIYPLLVAKVINNLCDAYQKSDQPTVKGKLINGAVTILPPQLKTEDFLKDIMSKKSLHLPKDTWYGFFH